ncbi:ABC transporter substrate-binding protein [Desulfovibrio mangrovi]|uniref:ABC transporter substrate-binding protein n=1 Tax=Desulfovibrio mangrovi TaxID=2976983 RepID=UPI002247BED7|nr:ABC transporter substrate-binding protein [Desulfovibrio mangrovi]UZP68701.1 ABC transporter substrate-binding protein [Desulfovibrio mangrovi]
MAATKTALSSDLTASREKGYYRENKLFPLLLCALFLLLALPQTASATFRKVTLQLHWQNQFEFAGYYAAIEQGYYRQEGLDVTILEGGPGIVPITQIMQGKAEFCVGGSEMLLARLRGQPVVALAAIFQHSAATLLVRSDSGIYTPQDLAGRILEMGDLESDAEIYALLMNEGLTKDKVIHVPSTFTMDGIVNKKVEALSSYLSNQPFFLKKASIPYRLLRPLWYGIDFYGDSLFTTETLAAQDPDLVEAFTRASLKGWHYALNHPDELIRTISTKYPPSLIPRTQEHLWFEYQEMKKLIMPTVIEIGHMNPGRFRHMADTFVQLGLAKPGYNLNNFIYRPTQAIIDWHSYETQFVLYATPATALLFLMWWTFRRRLFSEHTLRVQTESDLDTMRFKTRQILASTQAGYWEWDIRQNEFYLDERAASLLGLPSVPILLTPEEIDKLAESPVSTFHAALKAALQDSTETINLEFRTSASGLRWVACNGTLVQTGSLPPRQASGTLQDITPFKQLTREVQEITHTGALNAIPNRHLFFQKAEACFDQVRERGTPASIAILDIDQTSELSGTHGIIATEQLIKHFNAALTASLRHQDTVALMGTSEFFILFPEADKTLCRTLIDSFRATMETTSFSANGTPVKVTFSGGIADTMELPAEDLRPRALIAIADKRLNMAKKTGQDRVVAD